MIPQHLAQAYLDTAELIEIAPGMHVDVKLYCIVVSNLAVAELLTNAVSNAAKKHLHNCAE